MESKQTENNRFDLVASYIMSFIIFVGTSAIAHSLIEDSDAYLTVMMPVGFMLGLNHRRIYNKVFGTKI